MQYKTLSAAILAAGITTLGVPAQAGWYAGIGVGQTSADIDATAGQELLGPGYLGVPYGTSLGLNETWSSDSDDADSGLRVFVGYDLAPNFAIEGAYVDLGEFTSSASLNVPTVGVATAEIVAEGSGFELAGLGKLPVGPGALFAKAGLFMWDLDVSGSVVDTGLPMGSASLSDDGTAFLFGVGYQFDMGQFALRAEWTRYADVGDEDTTGQSDVDWLGVSGVVKF